MIAKFHLRDIQLIRHRLRLTHYVLLLTLLLTACGISSNDSQAKILYVYDVSAQHFNHHEYCLDHSSPGNFCDQFGPAPQDRSFAELLYDYDTTILVSVLQGIVNKEGPRLYLNHDHDHDEEPGVDKFWLAQTRDPDKPYGWLASYQIKQIETLDKLLDTFRKDVQGVVIWDDEVPATLNAATTIAGVENWVVLRDGSELRDDVTKRWEIKKSLVGMFGTDSPTILGYNTPTTGSAKNDVYVWLREQYLETGKTNPRLLAYFEDGYPAQLYQKGQMTRCNPYTFERDYAVQHRAFVYDLSPWALDVKREEPEFPVDDPEQEPGTDLMTLNSILREARERAGTDPIQVLGYIPWCQKYSDAPDAGGTHDPVAGEWESTWNLSTYGAYMAAGGGELNGISLANLSIHSQAPFPDRVVQNPIPTRAELIEKGYLMPDGRVINRAYILYYAGDYDLAHSVYALMEAVYPRTWRDEKRGEMPLAWGVNAGLIELIPDIMHYIYYTKTPNDYFVGANSGAGYMNPGAWPPYLDERWTTLTLDYYRRLNYSIQGWILSGKGGAITDERKRLYLPLAGDGIAFYYWGLEKDYPRLFEGVPLTKHWLEAWGMATSLDWAVDNVHNSYFDHVEKRGAEQPAFLIFRTAWTKPSFLWEVTQRVQEDDRLGMIVGASGTEYHPNYTVVDPYTFFYLMRTHLGGENKFRATYVSDNIPPRMKAGAEYPIHVMIRNDGWDTWHHEHRDTPPHEYRLGVHIQRGEEILPNSTRQLSNAYQQRVSLPHDVPPGGTVELKFVFKAPEIQGEHVMQLDMVAEGLTWFESQYDIPWQVHVVIEP